MECMTKELRSAVKWHGGKSYLCRRFVDLFPKHDVYCEPFAGGLSVLLNKPRATVEVVGDLNSRLMGMWRAIRDSGYAFHETLSDLDYSETTFSLAKEHSESGWEMTDGLNFLIQNRMSRGGLGKTFAWSDRLRGGQPGDVNAWKTFVSEHFPRVAERMQGVLTFNQDAVSTIRAVMEDENRNGKQILIYADPPYLHETRTAKKAYAHEMTARQHYDLLDWLDMARCRGAKVFVSGYPSELYRRFLVEKYRWKLHEFPMPNHSGQGKTKQTRIECLWESPDQ